MKARTVAWTYPWLIALGLAGAVLAVYCQTWGEGFEFVNYDDDYYVTANSHVQGGLTWDGVRWAFTSLYDAVNWHPLTWLSLQLDAQLFGVSSGAFHRTNVLLHAANTVLVFWLLRRITGAMWPSAVVAAFFGLHPTHVESVAWVTERKDVLSTLFWLLTTAAYAWYAERPVVGRYLLVVVLFALGLMAKPMLVTLPATLLLLDYWPLRRWPADKVVTTRYVPAPLLRLALEKLPLFALVVPCAWLTLQAQSPILGTLAEYTLSDRVAQALVAYVQYLVMTVWPVELAVFYPHPRSALPLWQPIAAGVLLAAITVVCLRGGRSRHYLAVGWLWYLGTLVPVIGLVQTGHQALADRFTYVPHIGLFVMAAWGVAELCPPGGSRVVATILAGAALACCTFLTWQQIGTWRDSETLWRHALAVTAGSETAHAMLAMAHAEKGRSAEAVEQFRAALRLNPDNPASHGNLAAALVGMGRFDDAGSHFERSLQLRPDEAKTHYNLGQVRERQGRHRDAVRHFTDALRLAPQFSPAAVARARALAESGEYTQAREQLDQVLAEHPASAPAHLELGRLLKRQGKLAEALPSYDRALELQPDYAAAWNNKGVALEGLGRLDDAAVCYQRAVAQEPRELVYRLNLGYVQYERGQEAAAAEQYRVASELQPRWTRVALAEAWQLATGPSGRDGALALRTAKLVCQATNYRDLHALDVMAAAYAELGRFDDALALQRQVLARLPNDISPQTRTAVEERLRLYERRPPYRAPANAP